MTEQNEHIFRLHKFLILYWAEFAFFSFIVCLTLFSGLLYPLEFVVIILLGWAWILYWNLQTVPFDFRTIAVGLSALSLFLLLLHRFVSFRLNKTKETQAPPWSLRSSAMVTLILCAAIMSGIGLLGVLHQSIELMTSPEPIILDSQSGSTRMTSLHNLLNIGSGSLEYHEQNGQFPSGQLCNDRGKAMHSWITSILPMMDNAALYRRVDLDSAWDSQVNQPYCKLELISFLNPGIHSNPLDEQSGFAVSHYAGNVRVLGRNFGMKTEQITDGLDNTILFGEINSQFEPWAKPGNLRDPVEGLNQSPFGFGSPFQQSVLFFFAGGNAKSLSSEIDPAVLKALSTPAGNEKMADDF